MNRIRTLSGMPALLLAALQLTLATLLAACGASDTATGTAPSTDPASRKLAYYPVISENAIYVVDHERHVVLKRIPGTGSSPGILRQVADDKLYTMNFGAMPPYEVTVVNTTTDRITAHIPLPGWSSLNGVATADRRYYYVFVLAPDATAASLAVIDTATDSVARILKLPALPATVAGMDISRDGTRCYLIFGNGTVAGYDTADGAEINPPISVGGLAPTWLNVSGDGARIYTYNSDDNFGVIDTRQWRLVRNIPTPAGLNAVAGAMAPDGRYLYASLMAGHQVWVIDTQTDEVVEAIEFPEGIAPIAPTFSPDGDRVYFTTFGDSSAIALPVVAPFATIVALWSGQPGVPGKILGYDRRAHAFVGESVVTPGLAGFGAAF